MSGSIRFQRSVAHGLAVLALILASVSNLPGQEKKEESVDALLDLRLSPIEKKDWRFDQFPILAWWCPPGTATLEDFKRYKDAGFTLYVANPDDGFEKALEYAREAGLDVMAFRKKQGFALGGKDVVYPEDGDYLVGWLTNDEPNGVAEVIASIEAVHALMKKDPTRWALFNLLPPFAQKEPGTEAIIDAAVRNGLPILSYDHYIMMADGTTRDQAHFENLELFRRKSFQHNVPFWAFALTIKHFDYRRPSESDVRFKQFTNLAYGAKGLWYFTYWGPTDWDRWDKVAIVDPSNGSPTELYSVVRDINLAVQEVGDLLLNLRTAGVFHNKPKPGSESFTPGTYWISALKARDALIGFFEDNEKNHYAWVVNKRHGAGKSAAETADTITLTFSPQVESVDALSWLDGQKGPIELKDGSAELTVAGGTGVLIKARLKSEKEISMITKKIMEAPEPVAKSTLAIIRKVADWQLDHMTDTDPRGWIRGAFLTGLMAAWRATEDDKYYDAAVEFGQKNDWKLGTSLPEHHADDHCVGQMYTELYEVDPKPERIADVKSRFDWVMANRKPGREDYWWCDSLFMAPTVYARLSKVTGDPKYIDYVTKQWKDSTEFLFDKKEHLYYRDKNYFDKKEKNGKPVFWSRGNGWSFAGLARVIQYLPEDYPDRPYYVDLFKTMADKIVEIQDERDGLWRSGLLDPDAYPYPETSGSGFFCFGLAWGVNEGILKDPKYEKAARHAWKGLIECVFPDGMLGYTQPVGAAPGQFGPTSTWEFGTGAFLLAGEQMLKMLEEKP